MILNRNFKNFKRRYYIEAGIGFFRWNKECFIEDFRIKVREGEFWLELRSIGWLGLGELEWRKLFNIFKMWFADFDSDKKALDKKEVQFYKKYFRPGEKEWRSWQIFRRAQALHFLIWARRRFALYFRRFMQDARSFDLVNKYLREWFKFGRFWGF